MAGAIICGVDGSESAKRAARVACALSAELGLELFFVRIVEPQTAEAKVSAVADTLEQLRATATEVAGGAHWVVDAGHPADRLVAAAHETEAAMIVVGSTGPRSSLLGSISADVSRRAPCPVVVVPPGADAQLNGGDDDGGHRDFAGGIARFGFASRLGDESSLRDAQHEKGFDGTDCNRPTAETRHF